MKLVSGGGSEVEVAKRWGNGGLGGCAVSNSSPTDEHGWPDFGFNKADGLQWAHL